MNKKQDCTFWLSVAAMIISVIAVCVTLIRCEPFDIDGISVLIGIMALVVTIYMSIQIVNALTLERRIRKSLQGDIDKSSSNILYHNMYLTFFFQGVNEMKRTHGEAALYYLFKSMECLTKTDIDQDKMDEIVMKIKLVHKDYPAVLSGSDFYEYARIVLLTKRKDCEEIIKMLENMREK